MEGEEHTLFDIITREHQQDFPFIGERASRTRVKLCFSVYMINITMGWPAINLNDILILRSWLLEIKLMSGTLS